MATPTAPFDSDESLFDSGNPFKGVVFCCTSVPTELRVSCLFRVPPSSCSVPYQPQSFRMHGSNSLGSPDTHHG